MRNRPDKDWFGWDSPTAVDLQDQKLQADKDRLERERLLNAAEQNGHDRSFCEWEMSLSMLRELAANNWELTQEMADRFWE